VTKTPVCVLGLGLIGGSLLRATVAAGREAFGYNRSREGAHGARNDGFAATTDLTEALTWAAERRALIVLAVPMPAVGQLLGHVRQVAGECPLTDVISVKGAVLAQVRSAGLLDRYVGGHPMAGTAHSGWSAGAAGLFTGAPWVISVDEHVDAAIWAQVMHLALDCGGVVVPAKSDEHDAAAAATARLRGGQAASAAVREAAD
jgi:prephenate dehydrogenase